MANELLLPLYNGYCSHEIVVSFTKEKESEAYLRITLCVELGTHFSKKLDKNKKVCYDSIN